MPTKHPRINLTFTPDLYQVTKQLADASGMSLSGLITHLIRGASPYFPVMTDVLLKGKEYDNAKAIQLQTLLMQTINPHVSDQTSAGASEGTGAGGGENSPRPCNTGAKMGKRSKIYH